MATHSSSLSSSVSISPSISSSSISNHHQQQQQPTSSRRQSNSHELEDRYGDTTLYPCPSKFEKIVPLDERYITHTVFLKNKSSETTFIGLLTSKKFYKVDSDTLKKIWTIDLFDMHSIEGDESPDPKTLRIVYHVKQQQTPNQSGQQFDPNHHHHQNINDSNNPELSPPDSPTIQSRISTSMAKRSSNDNYMAEKILIAESEETRDQWLISLRLLTRQTFQKYFEASFIPAPAIYQLHVYAYKTNRKGKNQVRCILISTERCYNISIKTPSLEIGKVKWSFPIGNLKSLSTFKNAPNTLVLILDNKENTKVKEQQQFILKDQIERNLLINEIRRIFLKITKQHLTKDEKDEFPKKASKPLGKFI
ncbi:hypothetical protein DICPUDRAFT_159779 [Dictyostelium purpureum]|uniref:PH domain-containing protein n=1 Tax=Dictyostelium purpureum TaxID=5786 RepID=F1A4Z1_DICPU|nr:uncharacterized protein DICPUDRAFT_159779 [Dictyostelium purpureum]EGC28738.1 hypothetical protein DICPUDRAFT_159779 [Dictyostelium purpureum]|eukprot:XP_003294738.1 hypothetical protein DICPUDRAFT_159779 [Dictyostelium purpureum]